MCSGVAAGDGPDGETGPEPSGYLKGSGGAGGQEDSELFTAEPADYVIGRRALASRQVAVGVVDGPEVVDVEHRHRDRAAGALGGGKLRGYSDGP